MDLPEPDLSEPGRCVEDPGSCISGDDPDRSDPPSEEDQGGGGAAPGRGGSKPGDGPGGGGPGTGGDPTVVFGPAAPVETVLGPATSAALEPNGVGGFGGGLADATRQFAFPIGIAALVGAYLLVQGRMDGKDPKLAAAPIDSRDDLVIYR